MNKNRFKPFFYVVLIIFSLIVTGCGASKQAAEKRDPGIEDGTYIATFKTDNAMFHVSEANQDLGILTVRDGKMTIHVSLQSKKILNLYPGKAEDAVKDGAKLLEPSTDTVKYGDGTEEEVYGFDIPVPALDDQFDLALVGTKGKWYDHKVIVSDPVPGDDIQAVIKEAETGEDQEPADGQYRVDVTLDGGTGKASITSPAVIKVSKDSCTAVIEWSSPHYDYMIVNGEKYLPVNEEGNSVFEIPVSRSDDSVSVIADTTAMSEPHEIEYTLTFDWSSMNQE